MIEEEEFYSYMLQQLKEKDSLVHVRSLPFQDPPKFKHNMHSKETLCRMVANGNCSRYITVSKVHILVVIYKALDQLPINGFVVYRMVLLGCGAHPCTFNEGTCLTRV